MTGSFFGGELQHAYFQRNIKLHQVGAEIDSDFPLVLALVLWRHQENIITKCNSEDEAVFIFRISFAVLDTVGC